MEDSSLTWKQKSAKSEIFLLHKQSPNSLILITRGLVVLTLVLVLLLGEPCNSWRGPVIRKQAHYSVLALVRTIDSLTIHLLLFLKTFKTRSDSPCFG